MYTLTNTLAIYAIEDLKQNRHCFIRDKMPQGEENVFCQISYHNPAGALRGNEIHRPLSLHNSLLLYLMCTHTETCPFCIVLCNASSPFTHQVKYHIQQNKEISYNKTNGDILIFGTENVHSRENFCGSSFF